MATAQIGKPVRRVEDQKFITGAGRYTDDIQLPGMTYCAFVRSPHAHAAIEGVDTAAASAAPGVVAVLTGADVEADGLGGLPCAWQVDFNTGEPMNEPPHPVLASDTVRYVGDGVACVIAETLEQAQDAAELVDVSYRELPAVASVPEAIAEGATQIHAEAQGNLAFIWDLGDREATDAACANAAHVTTLEFVNQRLIPNAIEPRATLADFDAASGRSTLYTSTQNPHTIRAVMGGVLGLPEHKLRVVGPDVGGGFGSKIFHYPEEAAVTWAARRIGRPVKWTASRTESFMTDAHGRDHVTTADLALDADGKFTGLRVRTQANMGAYLSLVASAIPTYLYGTLLQGQYTTPAIHVEVTAAFTTTTPVDAYRGAGRPEATYLLERLVDTAAHETGVDPAEIRRRNFIPPFDGVTEPGYETQVAMVYDSGNYGGADGPGAGGVRPAGVPRKAGGRAGGRKAARRRLLQPTSRRAAWRRPRWPERSVHAAASTRARPCACSPRAR